MRIFATIFISILFVSCSTTKDLAPADPSTSMMKQADKIILVTDIDPKQSYRRIGQYLTDQGFSLDQTDADMLTVQTGYQTFGGTLSEYRLRITASVRDSAIHFRGNTGNQFFGEVEVMNGKRGKYGNSVRKAWNKMVEISKGYPHNTIYYSRN